MQKLLAAALLSAAVFSAPAYAQTAQPADRAAPAATAGSQEKMNAQGKLARVQAHGPRRL